jgi:hypothetical protein
MTPKTTYTKSLYGSPALTNLRTPTKPPVWGMPTSGGTPTPTLSTTTANSTSAYPKSVNSPNPTAGNITPSNPGATGTTQGANTPATSTMGRTSSVLSPAGQDYASKLAGITSGLNQVQTDLNAYKAGAGKTSAPEKKDSEYLKYLRSMFNPDEAKRAQENVNNLNKMQADEIARNRKEQDRIQKNEAGMIERGQTFLSTNSDRASAKALADIAIAKGYSTDILNQFTAAGKSIYEAEEAMRKEAESPLTLEEAKALGLPFGTTMAEARKAGKIPSNGTGTNDASVFAYADLINSGGMDISNVPEEYRGLVAQAVAAGGGKKPVISDYQQERITRNINSIDDLVGQVSKWTTGPGSLLALIPGTAATDFKADVNTLAANIAFGELTAMREASKTGGALGAVSERELQLLESALGSLDRAQSPTQFKQSLATIKESIQRWKDAVDQYGTAGGGTGGGDASGLYDF